MRAGVRRLQPHVHTSRSNRRYVSLELGKLTRVEDGGYKLQGPIFATSGVDRAGMHRVLDELMDRLDEGLEAARATPAR